MEIFSYIIEGKLSHKDSKGHAETLSRGAVQYMSAGTGVFHSEMNNDPKQYCRFLQTWIQPHENGLPVQYGSKSFTLEERHNNLLHVISGIKSQAKAPIRLAQDVNVYVSEMDKNHEVSYELGKTRKAYVVCIEGILDLNGVTMNLRDAMRIWGPCTLKMKATGDTEVKILPKDMRQHVDNGERPSGHFMMVELPKDADELD
jgi:redox-sensitive bicupin YhaK (pirin superfamily)